MSTKSLTRASIAEKIRTMIVDFAGVSPDAVKNDSTEFGDLGLDSLDEVEFIMELEDEYGIAITEERANEIRTIKNAIDLVVELTGTR